MAANRIQADDSIIEFTATTTARSSGDIFAVSGVVGIAVDDIAAGAVGNVFIKGIFELTTDATDTFTAGEDVYLTSGVITTTQTSGTRAGIAAAAKATATTIGRIALNVPNVSLAPTT